MGGHFPFLCIAYKDDHNYVRVTYFITSLNVGFPSDSLGELI